MKEIIGATFPFVRPTHARREGKTKEKKEKWKTVKHFLKHEKMR
jgi:hypothetical protein